jgi:hypothetical protein
VLRRLRLWFCQPQLVFRAENVLVEGMNVAFRALETTW